MTASVLTEFARNFFYDSQASFELAKLPASKSVWEFE